MQLARVDSAKTVGSDRIARRYRLVATRAQTHSERFKRFRLTRADGLPPLERLEPATRSNPAR